MLFDHEKELESVIWRPIIEMTTCLDTPLPSQIAISELLKPPIHENLSKCFLQQRRAEKTWQILNTNQLVDIASSVIGSEMDIDEVPGIYLFVRLAVGDVLKVGQAGNLRERICKGHLRYGYEMTESKLIDFCKQRWEWPDALHEQEITVLMFPMLKVGEQDRCFVEYGLHKLLYPEMP